MFNSYSQLKTLGIWVKQIIVHFIRLDFASSSDIVCSLTENSHIKVSEFPQFSLVVTKYIRPIMVAESNCFSFSLRMSYSDKMQANNSQGLLIGLAAANYSLKNVVSELCCRHSRCNSALKNFKVYNHSRKHGNYTRQYPIGCSHIRS